MTQKRLDALVAKWQKELRLQDWTITASICRSYDMPDSDLAGNISMNFDLRLARIKLLSVQDQNCDWFIRDLEEILIHELLHVHFWSFDPDLTKVQQSSEEQVLNALAACLYRNSR